MDALKAAMANSFTVMGERARRSRMRLMRCAWLGPPAWTMPLRNGRAAALDAQGNDASGILTLYMYAMRDAGAIPPA